MGLSRRWRGAIAVSVLVAALAGCGADRVGAVADDQAHTSLEGNVRAVTTCLGELAPTLDAASSADALAEELSPCIDTRILNRNDDYILSGQVELPVGNETIGVTATHEGSRVVLELATQGVGVASAGVASERVTLTTCWRVAVDLGTDRLGAPSNVPCHDAVVERINPSDVVSLPQPTIAE